MLPVVLAQLEVVPFTDEQKLLLGLAWVLLFLIPAFGVRAHAKRHGRPWGKWFALTLVASLLGVLEYWEDKAVTERRAKRAAKAAAERVEPPAERPPE